MEMADSDDGWETVEIVREPHIFPAMFHGHCADCGGDIEPADPIGYIDDAVCCEDCVAANTSP